MRVLETLGRDRLSATFLVRDARGRRRIARRFDALSPGLRAHLPFVYRLQRSLNAEGLIAPDGLVDEASGVIWLHRAVRAPALSHATFEPAAALTFMAAIVRLVASLHERSIYGIELKTERLFVEAGRPILTGLVCAPDHWAGENGLAALRLAQLDWRVDVAQVGTVMRAVLDRTRAEGAKRLAGLAELRRYAAAMTIAEPEDRPSLEEVAAALREQGGGRLQLARPPLPVPRLVGRDVLLRELEAMVDRAVHGTSERSRRPILIALVGRAGVGKTRALAALGERCRRSGYEVLAVRARTADRRPLGPIHDLLSELRSGSEVTVEGAEEVEEADEHRLSPVAERHRQIEWAVRSLRLALPPRPALLLVEDVDRLPPSALEALAFLVREVALDDPESASLAVMVTLRPGDGDSEPAATGVVEELREDGFAERVRLPPLDSDAVREMLASIGVEAGGEAERVAARTGGYPRQVEELVRLEHEHRREGAVLDPDEVLGRRVRLIEGVGRRVLDALAIVDRPADVGLIAALIPARERRALLAEVLQLVGRRLIVARSGFRFELASRDAASVVRALLPSRRRRLLHRAAGSALEERDGPDADPGELARHYELGGVRDRFLLHGRRAAVALAEAHANEEAVDLYGRLLDVVSKKEAASRVELLERVGVLRALVGDDEGVVAAYRELLTLAQEPSRRWLYYKSIGRAHRNQEDRAAAAEAFDRGLTTIGEGNDLAVADLLSEKAYMLATLGDAVTARGLAEMAGALAEQLSESREVAEVRNRIGATFRLIGDRDRAVGHLEVALRISEKVGALELASQALNNLGYYLSLHGERERALQHLLRSLELCERIGDVQAIAITSANIGAQYLRDDEMEKAERYLEAGLKTARRFGHDFAVNLCLSNLAELHSQRARYGQAIDGRLRVLRMAERLGRPQDHAEQLVPLIRDYIVLGCGEEAERSALQLMDAAKRRDDARLGALAQFGLAGALRLRRDTAGARRLLVEAEAVLRDIGAVEELVMCLLARADVELDARDTEAAVATAEDAVTLAAQHAFHSDRAYALLLAGEGLLDDDLRAADRAVREAAGIAAELDQPELRWRCEYLTGEVAVRRGESTGAMRRFALASELLDGIVEAIADPELSYGYMRDRRRLALLRLAREVRTDE